jgi:flagellar M-ring protein FliF
MRGGSGGGVSIGGGGSIPMGLPNAPFAAALPSPDGAVAIDAIAEPSIDIAQIQGRVRASSVKKVAEVVEKHPDESVQIIRGWLNNAL